MKNKVEFFKQDKFEIVQGSGKIDLPYHTHKSYTLVLVTSGILTVCVNGICQNVGENTMIVLPPNNGISMTHVEEYSYISLSLYEEFCSRLVKSVPNGIITSDMGGRFANFLSEIEGIPESEFISKLEACISLEGSLAPKEKIHSLIVQRAIEYMDKRTDFDFSMEQMAEDLNVSQAYLSRAFKKEMCITPKQYMIQNRLRQVKRQLQDSDDETSIALDNGFSAESHLCSVFKKYMGVSITDYKKCIK